MRCASLRSTQLSSGISFNFGLLTQILCTQFVFVFATGAACVASQAMISAAFSIVKQSIALGCFPQLSVQHVSDKVPYKIPLRSCICSDIVPAVLRLHVVIHHRVFFLCILCHVEA